MKLAIYILLVDKYYKCGIIKKKGDVIVTDLFLFLGLICWGLVPIIFIVFIIRAILKKEKKKSLIATGLLLFFGLIFLAISFSTSEYAVTEETTIAITTPSVSFDEIYNEYKSNEIRANERFKGNRYTITAKVNGINDGGGLLNFDESINLTMEKKVGNTITFFYASFKKDEKENLKNINVGDTITFEGTCYSVGNWEECILK